jgi:hypothetical protein
MSRSGNASKRDLRGETIKAIEWAVTSEMDLRLRRGRGDEGWRNSGGKGDGQSSDYR